MCLDSLCRTMKQYTKVETFGSERLKPSRCSRCLAAAAMGALRAAPAPPAASALLASRAAPAARDATLTVAIAAAEACTLSADRWRYRRPGALVLTCTEALVLLLLRVLLLL